MTGNVAISATSLYANSTTATTAISNTTATAVAHNLGQVYARGPLSVSDRASLTTSSLWAASTTTLGNTTTTAVAHNLGQVYAGGAMSVTGNASLTTTSVLANSSLTINNTNSTATSAGLGNVRTVGAFSVSGPVALTTTALYSGSSLTIGNTGTTVNDNLGAIYAVGDLDVSGNVNVSAPSYLYGDGDVDFTGPSTGTTTDEFGLVYTSGTSKTLTFSGNVQIHATSVVANGDFTIGGATIPTVKHWLGQVFVAAFSSSSNPSANHGDVNWSGTASVTSKNWWAQAEPPQPMWLGRYFRRDGTYNDVYGKIWVPGNSGTSVVFDTDGTQKSTVLCPLLCTTEKTQVSGWVDFGLRTQPMVYFFMCDNNGIYPQVVDWASTGTFYGLMVINESTIRFHGQSNNQIPSVEGAVFAGCPYDPTHTSGMSMSDIVLEDSCSIAYNSDVVGAVSTSSLRTTTVVTRTVPGSWQQLPTN